MMLQHCDDLRANLVDWSLRDFTGASMEAMRRYQKDDTYYSMLDAGTI
jgi:hypothetical protein